MPIRFRCEHCRALLSIATRKANTLTRCPTCGRDASVPAAEPAGQAPPANEAIQPQPPTPLPPLVFQRDLTQLLTDPPAPVPVPVSTPLASLPLDEAPIFLGVSPLAPATSTPGTRFKPRQYAALGGLVAALLFVVVGVLAALSERKRDEDQSTVAGSKKGIERAGPTPRSRPGEKPPLPLDEKPSKGKPPEEGVPPAPVAQKTDKAIARPELVEDRVAKAEAPPLAPRSIVKAGPPREEKPTPRPELFVMKRRQKLGAEDLRKQLLDVSEFALDAVPNTTANLVNLARTAQVRGQAYTGHVLLVNRRPDVATLPMRMGKDCHLGKEPAEALQVLSRKLRVQLEAATPRAEGDVRPNADKLRLLLLGDLRDEWLKAEAVPAMMQLLQAENTPIRSLLVELLGRIPGKEASEALALRASTDLAPEVREQAVRELKKRRHEEFAHVLAELLRYPWAPVADHAAEALATLKASDALPQVIKLLDGPDPSLFSYSRHGKQSIPVAREMVRVNHLGNCVLCHAPSTDRTDLVRGAVPTPGQPLPAPITTPQYYETGALFVRADVTYLKQDFSVMQPVEQARNWPAHQRYDYLVRERPLNAVQVETLKQKQREQKKRSPQRQAMLYVLRELTGEDHGSKAENWLIVLPADKRPKLSTSPAVGKD